MNGDVLLRAGDLQLPDNPARWFDRDAPLALEIGFGGGHYLSHLAETHPEWNLLGAEISLGSVWRTYRRMKREGVGHVRLYKGSAEFIVRDVIPDDGLHAVYVNFPDPWPRKRHRDNRLLKRSFFRTASARIEEGGGIFLTTDHPEYFEFACDEARASGLFDVRLGEPPEATLRTKYARRWQEQQKTIHHAAFTKTGRADDVKRIIRSSDMQHAHLTGDLSTIGSFEKQVRDFGEGHAIVLEAFRGLDGAGLLFKAVVEEPDLRQELEIQAYQKDESDGGGVYVTLQPFGDPLGTRGVREAVRAVADWLATHDGFEIVDARIG